MIEDLLQRVLEATGYMPDGEPAPGVLLDNDARHMRRRRSFLPDALWQSSSALTIYFKYEPTRPTDEHVAAWRQEIWNEGFAPLLWVVSPDRIQLYNGFGRPLKEGDATKHRIRTFRHVDAQLKKLDALAGRLAMETGQFWLQAPEINRKTSVDQQLLSDLGFLESDLVGTDLDRIEAQGLIGRTIFTQYLIDRNIVPAQLLLELCGYDALPRTLRDRTATRQLFAWLVDTFNGDMFPSSSATEPPDERHLGRVADFLEAVDPKTGQRTLFPYQFDVVPVELISSIYE